MDYIAGRFVIGFMGGYALAWLCARALVSVLAFTPLGNALTASAVAALAWLGFVLYVFSAAEIRRILAVFSGLCAAFACVIMLTSGASA